MMRRETERTVTIFVRLLLYKATGYKPSLFGNFVLHFISQRLCSVGEDISPKY